jgi:4-hydroxybenzoate polyprenyltransferase
MTAGPTMPLAPMTSPATSFADRFRAFAGDIKLSHSVFALPWAILATFLAAGQFMPAGSPYPTVGQVLLILLCMVSARTVAMASNRLLDASIDARNPRTARRAIPSGRLSGRFVAAVAAACAVAFVATTSLFGVVFGNWLPLALSVPVLAFISAYPLLKRFTRLCHYYLGAALGLAPICAWIAIAGRVDWPPVLLGAAVLLWTAGFDILYACQDHASDVRDGLHSVPARLGIRRALVVARLTHVACVAFLVAAGLVVPQFGTLYAVAVALAVGLLVVEHALVRADDLSKLSLAFFTVNGVIALLIGTLGVLDVHL